MSSDVGRSLYEEIHGWLTATRHEAEIISIDHEPKITNRIERDVLANKARSVARYIAALADRLELFDA